jgi:hypothetical protein
MKKKINLWIGILFLFLLIPVAMVQAQETVNHPVTGVEEYTIGVVVYDPDNPEMSMFMDYYRNYLEEGFPVKFYFSGKIASADEENAFIASMKAAGAQGIISFYGQDVPGTVKVCEEQELYYVLGSGTISDEDYDTVKENPWFLGTVGPDPQEEYQAGYEMADYFIGQGASSYLVMTGGSNHGNFMHLSRVRGILEALEKETGLELDKSAEELAAVEENTELTNADGSVSVVLCPGYTSSGEGIDHLQEAFAYGTYDTVMSAFYVSDCLDQITAKEEEQGSDIQVGTVDSFTDENFEAVKDKDSFGNPRINYVAGKYASMAGSSFAMMFNAISGHPEANAPNGETVRLYQGFWRAASREEFIELYGYTTGIYENAYSCSDLMKVMKAFNDEATPEMLRELTEAYTVEDVKERILEQ